MAYTEVFNFDAEISSANPDTNFGASDLTVEKDASKGGDEWRICALVDFSNLTDLTDPAQITSAKAWLYIHTELWAEDDTLIWRRLTEYDWEEPSVTYRDKKTGVAWAVFGGSFANPTSALGEPSGTGWFSVDVTDMVKDAVESRDSVWNAICLGSAVAILSTITCYSREDALKPYLEITYTPPAGENALRIAGVTWDPNVGKVAGVAETDVGKVSGVTAN